MERRLFPREEGWRERAACRGMDTSWWFPDSAEAVGHEARQAFAVCRTCPVQDACLAEAQESGALGAYGIWGGLSQRARARLRNQGNPPATPRARRPHWEHGTITGYFDHRCRCDPCRAAAAAYRPGRRRQETG